MYAYVKSMDEGKVTIYIFVHGHNIRVTHIAFTLYRVNIKINLASLENIATSLTKLLALTNNGKIGKTNSNLGAIYIQDKEHEKLVL